MFEPRSVWNMRSRNDAGRDVCGKNKNTWITLESLTIPETNLAPENRWLDDDRFLLGPGLLAGASC